MQKIRQLADEQLYWYPRNYCYLETVTYFIEVIQNFRAVSLKEAINLFVQELQHRQVINGQQEMISKQDEMITHQKINNVLTSVGIFTNLGVMNAVNNNAAAVNQNTVSVNNAASRVSSSINKAADAASRAANVAEKIWKKL